MALVVLLPVALLKGSKSIIGLNSLFQGRFIVHSLMMPRKAPWKVVKVRTNGDASPVAFLISFETSRL